MSGEMIYEWRDGVFQPRPRTALDLLAAATPAERRFKLAMIELLMDGVYPSGRQVYNRIGKKTYKPSGKVNLNGAECNWKDEIFELFGIEPYVGYTRRSDRESWEQALETSLGWMGQWKRCWRRSKSGRLEPIIEAQQVLTPRERAWFEGDA